MEEGLSEGGRGRQGEGGRGGEGGGVPWSDGEGRHWWGLTCCPKINDERRMSFIVRFRFRSWVAILVCGRSFLFVGDRFHMGAVVIVRGRVVSVWGRSSSYVGVSFPFVGSRLRMWACRFCSWAVVFVGGRIVSVRGRSFPDVGEGRGRFCRVMSTSVGGGGGQMNWVGGNAHRWMMTNDEPVVVRRLVATSLSTATWHLHSPSER